jgi:hypothetical protein
LLTQTVPIWIPRSNEPSHKSTSVPSIPVAVSGALLLNSANATEFEPVHFGDVLTKSIDANDPLRVSVVSQIDPSNAKIAIGNTTLAELMNNLLHRKLGIAIVENKRSAISTHEFFEPILVAVRKRLLEVCHSNFYDQAKAFTFPSEFDETIFDSAFQDAWLILDSIDIGILEVYGIDNLVFSLNLKENAGISRGEIDRVVSITENIAAGLGSDAVIILNEGEPIVLSSEITRKKIVSETLDFNDFFK